MTATTLTENEFSQHLNTKFRFKLDTQDVELELVEVERYGGDTHEQAGMERFSVYFDGPADPFLPQRTYSVEHARMGTFDLFIVPIARQQQVCRYEAVFNYFN
jgi:hypothetical protein